MSSAPFPIEGKGEALARLLFHQQRLGPALAGSAEQLEALVHIVRHVDDGLHEAVQFLRLFGLDQAHRRGRIAALEADIEERFAALEHQILFQIVPFERPHVLARSDVGGGAATQHHARPGLGLVMQEGRELVDVERLVGNEDIGRDELDHRPLGMAPLIGRRQDEDLLQTGRTGRGLRPVDIGQLHLALGVAHHAQAQIDRAGDGEMPAVELDRGGAGQGRFRGRRPWMVETHRVRRVPDQACLVVLEQPAGLVDPARPAIRLVLHPAIEFNEHAVWPLRLHAP